MDQFKATVNEFLQIFTDTNSTEVDDCESAIDDYKLYQFCLIPSIVTTLILAATKPRRHKLLSFLFGRPGLIFPMDTFTRSSRLSYCCAFGATGFLIYDILLNGKFAVDQSVPLALRAIISMFVYGLVFFPLFTSLALETAISYCFGALFSWMFFGIELYEDLVCIDMKITDHVLSLTQSIPSLICLAYLSISMPIKCGLAIYNKRYLTPSLGEDPYNETVEEIKKSFQGKHVTKLLKKPEFVRPPEGILNVIKEALKNKVAVWIYHYQSGFRYPTRLMSVMFMGACVVYVITSAMFSEFVPLLNRIIHGFDRRYQKFGPEEEDEDEFTSYQRIFLPLASDIFFILKVSLIVSFTIATCISYLTILHMLSSFRTNLLSLYKGDFSHIPPPHLKSAISLCTGSIKYGGFQVAYIVWAFIIMCGILFLLCVILATFIEIIMTGLLTDWIINKLNRLWPGLLLAIGLFILQYLLAKFFFLQDRGQHLRLDNRRFYFVFVYFMFFYNIFLGLFSCLLRIIKAMVVGTLFLSRLDNSTLPRKFEFFDPGFNAYQGYIHMEVAHTHPVVRVFLRLLVALSKSRRQQKCNEKQNQMPNFDASIDIDLQKLDVSENTDIVTARPVNVSAMFNWHVAYTLLHNPTVRIYRKGFMQSMKKARKEGFKVPISDQPITDFDIVKAQEERDRQKEEEKKSQSTRSGLMTREYSPSGALCEDEVNIKQTKHMPKKRKWFQKWKKSNQNLVALDNISDERTPENEYSESYKKTLNV